MLHLRLSQVSVSEPEPLSHRLFGGQPTDQPSVLASVTIGQECEDLPGGTTDRVLTTSSDASDWSLNTTSITLKSVPIERYHLWFNNHSNPIRSSLNGCFVNGMLTFQQLCLFVFPCYKCFHITFVLGIVVQFISTNENSGY